jgi:hypothetical protein
VRRGQVVLVDTNVIIEAFRARCWNALTAHFSVETVEKCYEEALTGDPARPGFVQIDPELLRRGLRGRHAVADAARGALAVRLAYPDALDAGESDLLAHAIGRPDAWIASCSDRAAVNAALELGLEDRFVSLEALAQRAGARPALRRHFSDAWLSGVRTEYKLDRGIK